MNLKDAMNYLDKLDQDEIEREERERELWQEREQKRERDPEAYRMEVLEKHTGFIKMAYGEDVDMDDLDPDDIIAEEEALHQAEQRAEADDMYDQLEEWEAKRVVDKYYDDVYRGGQVAAELEPYNPWVEDAVKDYAERIAALTGVYPNDDIEATLYAFFDRMRKSISEAERVFERARKEPYAFEQNLGVRFDVYDEAPKQAN